MIKQGFWKKEPSRDELVDRMEEALLAQEGEHNDFIKYQKARMEKHPEEFNYDSGINNTLTDNTKRMLQAIDQDPRTRKRDEKSEAVNLRRTKTYMEDLAKEEAKLTDSAKLYEQKIYNQMEDMGLGRQYNVGIPHWAQQFEEGGENYNV